MIYETVEATAPIRQGDIFEHVPRVDLSLSVLAVSEEHAQRETTWLDVREQYGPGMPVNAILPLTPVHGIVMTQDCDAARGESLCLGEIVPFLRVTGKEQSPPKTPRAWESLITQHTKLNLRYFYLPSDAGIGFPQPMATDFRSVIRVPRRDFEGVRELRVGRLNPIATEHFRETLAQFFRRYPYNEWYPLTYEQFRAYQERSPEPVRPYPWQEHA